MVPITCVHMEVSLFGLHLNLSHIMKNLFMLYANTKGAHRPAHPCNLISIFVVRCSDSIIPILAISKVSRH